jgi:hypothetical protein
MIRKGATIMSALLNPPLRTALQTCASALRKLADYKLPPALDKRLLDLGENKDRLGPDERAELMALIDFTEQRTIEKLEAELALRRLTEAVPDLDDQP